MNYSEAELRSEMKQQKGDQGGLYYSLVKKDAATLSFLTNERLLIYDDVKRILFYVNDFKSTPFQAKTWPQPKNSVSMPLDICNFVSPGSNQLQVRKTDKNQKGQMETVEWLFTFESAPLCSQWVALLKKEKDRLVEDRTGQKDAGFIHDALLEAAKPPPPPPPPPPQEQETILKPEEEIVKVYVPEPDPRASRASDIRRSNAQPHSNSVLLGASQSGIRDDNRNDNTRTKPPTPSNSALRGSANSNPRSQPVNNTRSRQNDPNESRSRLNDPYESRSRQNDPRQSRSRQNQPSREQENDEDWNFRFLKEPNELTVFQFEKAALGAFKSVWSKDCQNLEAPRRVYETQGLRIIMANRTSRDAPLLRREFRNYHFILEACKSKLIVGVPMCALITWQGVVALVKAPLPPDAQEISLSLVAAQLRELERYTRVSNQTLERAHLWDLTKAYGQNGDQRMVFVDGLFHYLPLDPDHDLQTATLRPEYMLDSVNQVVPGGDTRSGSRAEQKQLSQALQDIPKCLRQLAQFLDAQEVLWADALELKQLFHAYGIGFRLLPRVYEAVTSKQVRRWLQSVMAAKVAREQIQEGLLGARRADEKGRPQQAIEDHIRLLMEGGNSSSSEAWKELSLRFKKQFGTPLSNSELLPGFFLNSIIKLLGVVPDLTRLNRVKRAFKDEGVVGVGFIRELPPHAKGYYKVSSDLVQRVRYGSREERKSRELFQQIVDSLELRSRPLGQEFQLNSNYQPFYEYLAFYSSPAEFDSGSALKNVPIYESVMLEPPSGFSLRITKSFLQWGIKKERHQQFKKGVEEALKINEYWLEDGHLHQTDLLQLLSDYYAAQGNYEESINFAKEALSKTLRACGATSKRAGLKYYELAERELKAGRKKDSLQNFAKAKLNMEANRAASVKYPLLLMRMGSLHLNAGDLQACVEDAISSIRQFEEYEKASGSSTHTEGYKIKTYEVLARAYEIGSRKNELKEMAFLCAKKFNRASLEWTYEQMVRICLAAALYCNPQQKCTAFSSLCLRLAKDEGPLDHDVALGELMKLSQSLVVMEKFLSRFDSVQRISMQGTSKKALSQDSRDFLMISRRIAAVVGQDYVQGLVQQKQYE